MPDLRRFSPGAHRDPCPDSTAQGAQRREGHPLFLAQEVLSLEEAEPGDEAQGSAVGDADRLEGQRGHVGASWPQQPGLQRPSHGGAHGLGRSCAYRARLSLPRPPRIRASRAALELPTSCAGGSWRHGLPPLARRSGHAHAKRQLCFGRRGRLVQEGSPIAAGAPKCRTTVAPCFRQ